MTTRSKACKARTEGRNCARLSGHKGTHRPTLTKAGARPALAVEVLSADRYEVLPAEGEAPKVTVLPDGNAIGADDPQYIGRAGRNRPAPASSRSDDPGSPLRGRIVAIYL